MSGDEKSRKFILQEKFVCNTIMRVTYRDTDQMGFVYYSNYLVWFEIGRTELLRRCGKAYDSLEKEGIILPVRYCDCEYLKPVKYDEVVNIETILEELTRISIKFKYNIYSNEDSSLCASGSTKHIFISPDGKVLRAGEKIYNLLKECSLSVIEKCRIPQPNIYLKEQI